MKADDIAVVSFFVFRMFRHSTLKMSVFTVIKVKRKLPQGSANVELAVITYSAADNIFLEVQLIHPLKN